MSTQPMSDPTTDMLDSNLGSAQSSGPSNYAPQPEKPGLLKRMLLGGLLGLVGGAGQKNFASGVGAGGRYVGALQQQQVENDEKVFRDAQAASYVADAAMRQQQLDNMKDDIKSRVEAKDADQVKALLAAGLKPIGVADNDSKSALAALQQARGATADGTVPPVVTFHYGGKIVAFNLDDLSSNTTVLDQVNKAGQLMGWPTLSKPDFDKLPKGRQNDLIKQSFDMFNPVAKGGDAVFGQIEAQKNLINKAKLLPDSDNKAALVKNLEEGLGSLQAAAQASENKAVRVAFARGAAYGSSRPVAVIDPDSQELVIMPAGKAEASGAAPAAQGVQAKQAGAQFADIETGSQAMRQAITNLKTPLTADQITKLTLATHSDDEKVITANMKALASSNLTPDQQDFVAAASQLVERSMSLRKVAGMGQGSQDLRSAIIRTLPGAGSGNKEMMMKQLNLFDQQVSALKTGLPKVRGASNTNNAPATQSQSGPKPGDKKTFPNGRVGVWDGKGWVAQ